MTEQLTSAALRLRWSEAPWDEAVLGRPVWQIDTMELTGDPAEAEATFKAFEQRREARGVVLVSCRLPHQFLRESMFLEDRGFRFVEMVYRPERALDPAECWAHGLQITRAHLADLPELLTIAGSAFSNERFHMDPRLDSAAGDQRYRNWVRSALDHPRQQLYVLRDGARTIAFFVVEWQGGGLCYWHLNAIAPDAQGQGYGERCWRAMMDLAREQGCASVASSVIARNNRVVNLYAKLGFRFMAPSMTFHWVAGAPAR